MTGRIADRTKHRAPCTITAGGQRYNALVLDLSRTGLFIQTSAKPAIGDRLDIELVIHGKVAAMHVEVARRKQVPPQLLNVAHGGVGVRILSAPEEFYQLLMEAQAKGESNGESAKGARSTGSPRATPKHPPPRPARSLPPEPPPDPDQNATTAEPLGREYKVRIKQVSGSRTRTLNFLAADEEAVRNEIAEDFGDDWKVLEITQR